MFKKNEEVDFFEMFVKSANYAYEAAQKLLDLVQDYSNVSEKVNDIKQVEKEADENTHAIYTALDKAFITPIEREDILSINQSLDNVVDTIEQISKLFFMLDIKELREDVIPFTKLVLKNCLALKEAFIEFKNFKKSKKVILNKIVEVNSIEEEGDVFYENSVKTLFTSNTNQLDIIKWYEIYKNLEDCLDHCESVTNIMEGALLKNT